jgi:hypothetical protein
MLSKTTMGKHAYLMITKASMMLAEGGDRGNDKCGRLVIGRLAKSVKLVSWHALSEMVSFSD